MPRLSNSLPKYRKHKASGQAVVTLNGQDVYLGAHGSKSSRLEYERLIGEWLQNGRSRALDPYSLTIDELVNAYRKFAQGYYVKNGKPTGALEAARPALKLLRERYGEARAADFGPLALKAFQARMVADNASRRYVNDQTNRIRHMFKWAAGNELIPFETYHRLTAVEGLRKGRTEARERPPVPPVSDDVVEATLPHLPAIVADMVRFQRLTGCRPGEVCILRPCDVDTSGEVWLYRPGSHKTEHHGRERVIPIGPRGQDILRPYLLRAKESYCFSPLESEKRRRDVAHEHRMTPLQYGNRPGTNRKRKPKQSNGDCYTVDSYRRAVNRACDKAFPAPAPLAQLERESSLAWERRLSGQQRSDLASWQVKHRWSPNQLRHTAATEIRKRFGLEAAQVTLGHASADVTQVYAERDVAKAIEVMREVG